MFASTDLAARIDAAEARLSFALGEIAVARRPQTAFVERIGRGVAVFGAPASPINKMIGVGFEGPPPEAALDAIEGRFRERGAPLQAEVATLADPSFAALLSRRGYVLQGFENILGRRIGSGDGLARGHGAER